MSEATADDVIRLANEMADEKGRVKIGKLKARFSRMTSVQFDEHVSRAVNTSRLYLVDDFTLAIMI